MRHDKPFPASEWDLFSTFENMWNAGWLDSYSDEHFLIRALENRIQDIQWKDQFLNNNSDSIYSPIYRPGGIDYSSLSRNFVINLSGIFKGMINMFGEEHIKKFIVDQLSAGKEKYNENVFFQALSEIEILRFYGSRNPVNSVYEPPVTAESKRNPEASFEYILPHSQKHIKVNVEVKTANFNTSFDDNHSFLMPTILLNDKGREDFANTCKANKIKTLMPRVSKLVDFINSATEKFNEPEPDEYNLLYVNWSYSDYPICGFIEAWNLLTNDQNGLLLYPDKATKLNMKKPLNTDALKRITAIIVYTSSLEQLMFSDFSYSWQRHPMFKHRFRMHVINDRLREDELADRSRSLFQITGMNPDRNEGNFYILGYYRRGASNNEKLILDDTATQLTDIIKNECF